MFFSIFSGVAYTGLRSSRGLALRFGPFGPISTVFIVFGVALWANIRAVAAFF